MDKKRSVHLLDSFWYYSSSLKTILSLWQRSSHAHNTIITFLLMHCVFHRTLEMSKIRNSLSSTAILCAKACLLPLSQIYVINVRMWYPAKWRIVLRDESLDESRQARTHTQKDDRFTDPWRDAARKMNAWQNSNLCHANVSKASFRTTLFSILIRQTPLVCII